MFMSLAVYVKKGCDTLSPKKTKKNPANVKKMKDCVINPFALSALYLNYCIEKGWLLREQRGNIATYYLTKKGRKELPKMGIDVSQIGL